MKWKDKAINDLLDRLQNKDEWGQYHMKQIKERTTTLHLAIFTEPFLSLILAGEKTLESRFSKKNISPFKRIQKGDYVLLKRSGGPVLGIFLVGEVSYFSNVGIRDLSAIKRKFAKKIHSESDPEFWQSRKEARFITLVEVEKVTHLPPFTVAKKDRLGWTVLSEGKNDERTIFDVE